MQERSPLAIALERALLALDAGNKACLRAAVHRYVHAHTLKPTLEELLEVIVHCTRRS